MPDWRLSIATAMPPPTRLHALGRIVRRRRAALLAAAALLVTLLLGWSAPAPLPADIFFAGLASLVGIGLLAWQLARLTVLPLANPALAALAAALTAIVLLPGLGTAALVPALILSLWAGLRQRGQRVVALLVQCGALLSLAANPVNHIGYGFVSVTMLGFALVMALRDPSGAANDNPSMKRIHRDSQLPEKPCYDIAEFSPGKWGVS
jgi:hypothetical protein